MSENTREEKNNLENLSKEELHQKIESLESEFDTVKKDYGDLYDRHLRMAADFDNYKKRVTKEKAEVIAYGNEELIKALLNVLDNLERALGHSESSETEPIIEGVRLVQKQFLSYLEKFGVKSIEANKGQEFDPRYHQAIEHIETSDVTPGLILSEILRGYILKDRLLRPALVAVSKQKTSSEMKSQARSGQIGEQALDGSDEVLDLLDEDMNNN